MFRCVSSGTWAHIGITASNTQWRVTSKLKLFFLYLHYTSGHIALSKRHWVCLPNVRHNPINMLIRLAIIWTLLISTNIFGQSAVSGQEYEVYNFLIKKAFEDGGIACQANTKKSTPIFYGDYEFKNQTTVKYIGLAIQEYREFFSDSAFQSFRNLNDKRFPIDPQKLTACAHNSSKGIYISFSRCFIQNGLAVLYLGIQFGQLDGDGSVYILKQNSTDKSWTVLKKYRKWVS